jgi:hypothetical protein
MLLHDSPQYSSRNLTFKLIHCGADDWLGSSRRLGPSLNPDWYVLNWTGFLRPLVLIHGKISFQSDEIRHFPLQRNSVADSFWLRKKAAQPLVFTSTRIVLLSVSDWTFHVQVSTCLQFFRLYRTFMTFCWNGILLWSSTSYLGLGRPVSPASCHHNLICHLLSKRVQ